MADSTHTRPVNSAIKGRGAVSQTENRFAVRHVEEESEFAHESVAPETTLTAMAAKSIISSNQSPDIPFDRSINPYQGCEHGCVYCYARPSHSYLDLSPGLDFETQIFYKPNAEQALLSAWEKKSYECRPITMGANTDPYQPAERKLKITRSLLKLFLEHRHPVSIITKGTLMERDLDIIGPLADKGLCSIAVSIPTADNRLKRLLEPRVPAAAARFALIRKLADRGVPVSLMMAPIIPAINDSEIESILEQAAAAGVKHAAYIFLRLPHEVRLIVKEWLCSHFPDRAEHVMSLVRQASGGKDYDNRFGIRQRGRGPYADMIRQRFKRACGRFGMDQEVSETRGSLDCGQFRPPGPDQLDLGLF